MAPRDREQTKEKSVVDEMEEVRGELEEFGELQIKDDPTDLTHWEVDGTPTVPEDWDYKSSVKRCKNLFREVREKGAQAVIEVAIAHKALTERTKRKGSAKYQGKTFTNWCREVGIDPDTPRNWFKRHLPEYYLSIRYGTENTVSKLRHEQRRKFPPEWEKADKEEFRKEMMEDPTSHVRGIFMNRLSSEMGKVAEKLTVAQAIIDDGDIDGFFLAGVIGLYQALWPFWDYYWKQEKVQKKTNPNRAHEEEGGQTKPTSRI